MKSSDPMVIGMGAVTAVGVGLRQTATSVRAGIARFAESGLYDRHFMPFTMATVPEDCLEPLADRLQAMLGLTARQIRMLRLAGFALREAIEESLLPSKEMPLFLAGPEAVEGRSPVTDQRFLALLQEQSRVEFDMDSSEVVCMGRAGGLTALKQALDWLGNEPGAHAIVGGVDTFLDNYVMAALDADGRVLGQHVPDGFVPGEGAAFLVLGSHVVTGAPQVRIVGIGIGHERGHLGSEEPYCGDGLAQAFEACFDEYTSDEHPVQTAMTGLNGEGYLAKEWGVAVTRNRPRFADDLRIEHPVDCFGDPGAALGPLLVSLATVGIRERFLLPPALVWCSSDGPARAATIVDRVGNGRT